MNRKVTICFAGTARCIEHTYKNIQEYVINSFPNCDTFFCIKDDENAYKIEKYFKPTKLVIEKDVEIDTSKILWKEGNRGNPKTYMQMLYSRKRVNEIKTTYEEKNNIKYDIVIHSRLDVLYFNSLSMMDFFKQDMKYLYSPDFHNFDCVSGKGCNDRFAISNSENMDMFFNLYDYVYEESKMGIPCHGESTTYRWLKNNNINIKRVPIRFSRVDENGNERDGHLRQPKETWNIIEY